MLLQLLDFSAGMLPRLLAAVGLGICLAGTEVTHTLADTGSPDDLIVIPPLVPAETTLPAHDQLTGESLHQLADPDALFFNVLPAEPAVSQSEAAPHLTGPAIRPSLPEERQLLHPGDEQEDRVDFLALGRERYTRYRTSESSWTYLPASGDDFGWLSWQDLPYLRADQKSGLTGAINIHWLSGPLTIPVPPRLYDFVLGYQTRMSLSDLWSCDLATSAGLYTDFEGSARDGARFVSHAVGMFHLNLQTDLVFGVDYIDRDDLSVLPVFGISLRDAFESGVRLDLVFPRPRLEYALSDSHRFYLSGSMEGGSWDIDIPHAPDDVMTYRDLRLAVGIEHAGPDNGISSWELAWVFDRELDFRQRPESLKSDDFLALRVVWRH